MERSGLVGPMDEMLVMDVNPSEEIVYRVNSGSSSDAELSKSEGAEKEQSRGSL